MIIFRMAQSLLFYVALFLVRVLFVVLGFVVVPVAYLFRRGEHFPRWAWIWDNDEDGIFGANWFENYTGLKKGFKRCYWWSAVRNPANNMRFIKLFSVQHEDNLKFILHGDEETPDPSTARKKGGKVWHLTLVKQGFIWYFSFWIVKAFRNGRHFRFRVGWKCTPEWIKKPRASIYKDAGMTFQFLPYRKG